MTIGLFGTCGNSTWRYRFMEIYDHYGINYFNPQVDDWKPENAQIEAEHLANDEIILFPVTDETLGLGSLGEVGFSILQAIKLDSNRDIVVMIDNNINEESKLQFDESMVRESIKMRALIKAHLNKLKYPNVYMVENLENMLMLSLKLHEIHVMKNNLEQYTIKKI
jgi:hypothetical protein